MYSANPCLSAFDAICATCHDMMDILVISKLIFCCIISSKVSCQPRVHIPPCSLTCQMRRPLLVRCLPLPIWRRGALSCRRAPHTCPARARGSRAPRRRRRGARARRRSTAGSARVDSPLCKNFNKEGRKREAIWHGKYYYCT